MKEKYLLMTLFILYFFDATSQTAVLNGPGYTSTSDTNQYSEYLWSASSSLSNTIARVTNKSLTPFELTITLEGTSHISLPTPSTRFIAGGEVSNIRFPFSNAPAAPAIDGYAIFTFTPVSGNIFSYTPTGAPPIVRKVTFKRGEAIRWISATNINQNYTTIDEIWITNNYVNYDYPNANEGYNRYHFDTTNISSELTSQLIKVYVPTEKPVAGLVITPTGYYKHTEIWGDVSTPVRLLPGAHLKAVPDSYFHDGGNNRINQFKNQSSENFRLYPTIVTNDLIIKTINESEYQVQIYDLNNQKMMEKSLTGKDNIIDLSYLSENWYIVRLSFEDGNIESYKIFKK